MKLHAWLMLVSLAFVGSAAAQSQAPHVCGAGAGPNEVMAGMHPGGNGVAPTPLCYWKAQPQEQQQHQPPQPTGYWEKTWGAIASSESGGALGTALGATSQSQAEQLAIEDCKAQGGGGCKVALSYHNQCAAMVIGSKSYRMYGAASKDEAISIGMKECKAKQNDCRVYYSACTEPVFHKY